MRFFTKFVEGLSLGWKQSMGEIHILSDGTVITQSEYERREEEEWRAIYSAMTATKELRQQLFGNSIETAREFAMENGYTWYDD